MQNNNTNFGFNIITEKIENIEIDNESFEDGKAIKQETKPYTDDALILQSILEYSIGFGTENYFKSRDLSKNHLLDNCEYIYGYRISNILSNKIIVGEKLVKRSRWWKDFIALCKETGYYDSLPKELKDDNVLYIW